MRRRLIGCSVSLLLATTHVQAQAVPAIFDAGMGTEPDNALALAVVHALESPGEARILAVTLNRDNPFAAPYVDLVNTFHGRQNASNGTMNSLLTSGSRGGSLRISTHVRRLAGADRRHHAALAHSVYDPVIRTVPMDVEAVEIACEILSDVG